MEPLRISVTYKLVIRAIAIMLSFVMAFSCQKIEKEVGRIPGTDIQFGVSTGYPNGSDTRTEYSGVDESGDGISSTSAWERIDWVAGTDRIRILCVAAGNGPAADYEITEVSSASGRKSVATIAPVGGSGLQWGEGDHYFYAMYPAPGMESNIPFGDNNPVDAANVSMVGSTGNKAVISGKIPANQEVVLADNGYEFKANMNYAYMYAATKSNLGAGGEISLEFRPLVTAFEFSLLTPADDGISNKLTSITLMSSSTVLAGNFMATLSTDEDPAIAVSGVKEVTVAIPGGGIKLSSTNAYKVTVLTLPVDQANLVLTLNFEGNVSRFIELKDNGTSITVPACRKAYIHNLGVPGSDNNVWTYHFATADPTDLSFEKTTSSSGKVVSYRTKGGATEPVRWSVEGYYSDPDCISVISRPSWVRSMTPSGNGSPDPAGQTVAVQCLEINPSMADINEDTYLPASSFGSGSSKTNYYNLSNPSNMTSDRIAESANCYIVNGPGYYRIPLVMGNGIINNSVNPEPRSYQGNDRGSAVFFKDYKGNSGGAISSPYLHKTGAGVGVPTSAHVVWEDVENLIEADGNFTLADQPITTTGSGASMVYWLCFHVNDCPTGDGHNYKGNAVIAVTDNQGTVMWSWHIWVTDYVPRNYPGYSASANKDVLLTNRQGENYEIMPYNLGWAPSSLLYTYDSRTVYVKVRQEISDKTAVLNITQHGGQTELEAGRWPTFQNGRKDAMWPHSGYNNTEMTWWGRTPGLSAEPLPATIDKLIKTPDRFFGIFQNPDVAYLSEGIAINLWNATLTNNSNINYYNLTTRVKTIYDPCPAGYAVPLGREFSGFFDYTPNSTGSFAITDFSLLNAVDLNGDGIITVEDNHKGWYFYTNGSKTESVFFPSAFCRNLTYGSLNYNSTAYWNCAASGDRLSHGMLFNMPSNCGIQNFDRRNGATVRPVVE